MKTAFVFGASGEIGDAVVKKFKEEDYEIVGFSRNSVPDSLFSLKDLTEIADRFSKADCVVWASGANLNDSIENYNESNLKELLDANLFYITRSLSELQKDNLLSDNCRLVIISSVWQGFSKQNKFSYTVSKSALSGLIHSLTADLSPRGLSVNGVLPGVVDTNMTRAALNTEQIDRITSQTPSKSLVSLDSVAQLVYFLSSSQSQGINGQSIVIDGGWSVVRYV
jgi:NAD(P)-dependent dehydrogenase (short-subunit alcohol dehydrogenase family)